MRKRLHTLEHQDCSATQSQAMYSTSSPFLGLARGSMRSLMILVLKLKGPD